MEDKYILALDVGTTGLRAIAFDSNLNQVEKAYRETPMIIPHPGWREQDPVMIWEKTQEVIREILEKISPVDIAAMGITTQRATFTVWDPQKGQPLINIIGWLDTRTAEECIKMTRSFGYRSIRALMRFLYLFVKNPLFYAASKINVSPTHASIRTKWMLDHVPSITREKASKREILWGTVDTWLIWKLTEGRVHATDLSNLSCTGFLNPFTLTWNTLYIKPMNIPLEWMPEIKPTNGNFGETTLFGGSIPIRAVIGDQQASLFGHGCFERGDTKVTNGTGTYINMNTGERALVSKHGLIPFVAWSLDGEERKTFYTIEAEAPTCGELIDWLVDCLQIIKDPGDVNDLAMSVPDSDNVCLVPAFQGLQFPYWDAGARGAIIGLTRSTNKGNLARAALEGIGFRIQEIVAMLASDTKIPVKLLHVDGGVSKSDYLNQFIADMTGIRVERGSSTEMTAVGAAMLAGLAVGYWKDVDEIKENRHTPTAFNPKTSMATRKERLQQWQDAVVRSKKWVHQSR